MKAIKPTRTLGIKLTHDAGVALIEDDELVFSTELEKMHNAPRYTDASSFEEVLDVLDEEDVDVDSIDSFVIDGWKNGGIKRNVFYHLQVAPYHQFDCDWGNPLRASKFSQLLRHHDRPFLSYPHVTSHIIGAYMTAPFAGEVAYCVVWDGGVPPQLYRIEKGQVTFESFLGKLYGLIYGIMGYYAGPYKNQLLIDGKISPNDRQLFGGREIPGKLMSWIAHGKPNDHVLASARAVYDTLMWPQFAYDQTSIPEHHFIKTLRNLTPYASDEDFLASVHHFLQKDLVRQVTFQVPRDSNLIFVGGCALNIKWNSALRNTGQFADLWVPPFTNDAGSAIGAAATHAFVQHGVRKLRWNVYSGPKLHQGQLALGWSNYQCSIGALADFLFNNPDQPVVFLHGRAEIGPRALGHRSLIMNPESKNGQAVLNDIKGRESWRPVAPIALERHAAMAFLPGSPDPYMLFDHDVRLEWRHRIPAVVHMDGTARLQTVGSDGCPAVKELLESFALRSGYGILCNTSANLNGSGFFPDVSSAMKWGKCDYIWSDNVMHYQRAWS